MMIEAENGEEERKEKLKEKPPDDDCCPICFGDFTVSCRTNCGHWFCGNCILEFWTYRGSVRACKCPICTYSITKLTPEASLLSQKEKEVVEVLKSVQRYNRLYVGSWHGFLLKLPLFFRRFFWVFMEVLLEPRHLRLSYHLLRLIVIPLGWIYSACNFDFIPTGGLGIHQLLDICAFVVVIVLCLFGLYRKWVRGRRVRQLAMEVVWPN